MSDNTQIFVIVVGVSAFVIIMILILSYLCLVLYTKMRNHMPPVINIENGVQEIIGATSNISIQTLRAVTNNFSEDIIIGEGRFGGVYKGELHDGTKIGVKRIVPIVMGTNGLRESQAKIAELTNVRHRNLVALLGFCIHGNDMFLLYEYMPQGALAQHLFKWREHKTDPLTWKQRVLIALDVGRGLDYLHRLAHQTFIHRDLKPSNILLGDDMRAKVADIGLVKSAHGGKYLSQTSHITGTCGYMAPENAYYSKVTTKFDVYAFGVVLMELITGRKTVDSTMPTEKREMVTWVRNTFISKQDIVRVIDQTLDTSNEGTRESIRKVVELAYHCTASKAQHRPDMADAINLLFSLYRVLNIFESLE